MTSQRPKGAHKLHFLPEITDQALSEVSAFLRIRLHLSFLHQYLHETWIFRIKRPVNMKRRTFLITYSEVRLLQRAQY
jgi:hypothetical protein